MNLKILQLGEPILMSKAEPVSLEELSSEEIQKLLTDMEDTINTIQSIYPSPILGLSAPQVGVSKRISLIQYDGEFYDLISPSVISKSSKMVREQESCLSFFEYRGCPSRHDKIEIDVLNREGKKQTIKAEGIFSRIIQHEVDHLNGILYLFLLPQEDLRYMTSSAGYPKKSLRDFWDLKKAKLFCRKPAVSVAG